MPERVQLSRKKAWPKQVNPNVGFRCSPELRARIDAAAERDHRNISNWMKMVIKEALDELESRDG